MFQPKVEDRHFEFLKIQRGQISDLMDDRERWEEAYALSLHRDFQSMKPFLPVSCNSILDIASGLGGINILLEQHYPGCAITLLDGWDDRPEVRRHDQTFNSMGVAADFLGKNGVADLRVCAIDQAHALKKPFDLIISLQAWCFHFNPEAYLEIAADGLRAGGTLIVDLRKEYKTWRYVLERRFKEIGTCLETKKSIRVAYKLRQA